MRALLSRGAAMAGAFRPATSQATTLGETHRVVGAFVAPQTVPIHRNLTAPALQGGEPEVPQPGQFTGAGTSSDPFLENPRVFRPSSGGVHCPCT